MDDRDWVRITILDHSGVSVMKREVWDPWYRLGGYPHADQQQQARDRLASTELHEWFRRAEPAAGSYVLLVAALHRAEEERGTMWASVRATYPGAALRVVS